MTEPGVPARSVLPSRREVLCALAIIAAVVAAFWLPFAWRHGTAFFLTFQDPTGVDLYIPHQVATLALEHTGLPLWNPFSACGTPHFAQLQSTVLCPFNVWFYLLPVKAAAEALLFSRLIFAGLAAFVLGSVLGLSFPARLLLALAFPLNCFELRFANLHLNSDALLPLTLAAFLRLGATGSARAGLAATALVALHVLAGMPESAVFAYFLCASVYGYVALRGAGRTSWGGPARKWLVLAGVFAGGALLTAVQVVPFLEYLSQSWNTHAMAPPGSDHFKWNALPALFYPFLAGTPPIEQEVPVLGGVAFLLLLLGLRVKRAHGLNWFLLAFAGVLLLKLFGVPPLQQIARLPVFELLAYGRYGTPVLLLALLVIAALGLDDLLERVTRPHERIVWSAVLLVLLGVWWVARGAAPVPERPYAWMLLAITGLALFLVLERRWLAPRLLVLAVFALALGEQALHFSRQWVRLASYPKWIAPNLSGAPPAFVSFLRSHMTPLDRMAFANTGTGLNSNLLMGPLAAFGLFDAMFVRRYKVYTTAIFKRQPSLHEILDTDTLDSPLLDRAAVRFLVTLDPLPARAPRHWRQVCDDAPYYVYENLRVTPRAYVAHRVATASDAWHALLLLQDARLPWSDVAVIEGAESPPNALTAGTTKVEMRVAEPNRVVLDVEDANGGVLVLADTFYPGWRATVDGRDTRILHANHLFRGVPITAGRHVVEFRFAPRSVLAGAVISLVALAIYVAWCALALRRAARRASTTR